MLESSKQQQCALSDGIVSVVRMYTCLHLRASRRRNIMDRGCIWRAVMNTSGITTGTLQPICANKQMQFFSNKPQPVSSYRHHKYVMLLTDKLSAVNEHDNIQTTSFLAEI